MAKFSTLLTHLGILLIAIIFLTRIQISQSASFKNLPSADLFNDDDNSGVEEDRRMYDLNQLRRFLLTANAEQRAAKREQQDFYKRELIREYLQSATDQDPSRFQEIRKRFCASFDEFYATQAACLG